MKISLSILLCCFSLKLVAQNSDFIPFIAYWHKGDTYRFNVTKIKEKWEDDTVIADSTTFTARFTVIDSTEDQYTISWKYSTPFSNLDLPEEVKQYLRPYESIDVLYNTDALEIEDASFDMSDIRRFYFLYNPGIPERIEVRRVVESGVKRKNSRTANITIIERIQ